MNISEIDVRTPDDTIIQQMTNNAVAQAQRLLVELSEAGKIKFGQAILCAIRWPNQHKGEHFLFTSLNESDVIAVHTLSERATHRMKEVGGISPKFWSWCTLQQWHEQMRFRVNVNLRLESMQQASGLIIPGR